MNPEELIQSIRARDVDIDRFANLAIENETIRDEIIRQMISNPDIMVYYHCFYVAIKASEARPDLFYKYWHDIASLLDHKNSYHRDIALTILANLITADNLNLFSGLFSSYFSHINDSKFMTAHFCILSSKKIISCKPELGNAIIELLLEVDQLCSYSDKQKALLKADILEVMEEAYDRVENRQGIHEFINSCKTSISPKTKARARTIARKYGL